MHSDDDLLIHYRDAYLLVLENLLGSFPCQDGDPIYRTVYPAVFRHAFQPLELFIVWIVTPQDS